MNAETLKIFPSQFLRGISQVDLLGSPLTGAIFLIALYVSDWHYAVYGFFGSLVSSLFAQCLGSDPAETRNGLWGFNGCLVAIGCGVYLGMQYLSTAILAFVCCLAVVIVANALARVLEVWDLPRLTAPFCTTITVISLAAPYQENIWHRPPSSVNHAPSALSGQDILHGFFANFGQIFFVPQWYVGIIFLVGLLVASKWAAFMACAGSITAVATAWILGSPAQSITHGICGYNAVLVAIALCGVFIKRNWTSFVYALFGAAISTALAPAITAFFDPFHGHTLTWPFVVTTLLFLSAAQRVPRLKFNTAT